jgi:alpha-L-fucosidase
MQTTVRAAVAASLLTLCLHALAATASAQDVPRPLGTHRPSAATIAQWQDRRFGMFIHFGLYSALGGEWQGKRVDNGYSEQILANGNIDGAAYAATAASFNPVHFDAEAIARLAKAAGMKFIVITSKHHDGFNMFHTRVTPYNIVDATPFKRDVVKELAEACRKEGLAFGVYYSTIDWHHPGGNTYIEGNSNPITAGQEAFNVAQLKELLGNYGPIAEIWFDMGKPTPAQSRHFEETVHALQPQTMVSGRVWNHQGDFTVMGDNAEPKVRVEEPWQSPASMFPETWGYRSWQERGEVQAKVRENISRLVRVVSAGGNYILNIGPKGDGSVVPFEADVLRGIGAWMKTNGEAVYGTRASPFGKLDFGNATMGRDTVYLFIDRVPADGVLHLPGVIGSPFGEMRVLGGAPAVAVQAARGGNGLNIQAATLFAGPASKGFEPVVALALKEPLRVTPQDIRTAIQGVATLPEGDAEHFLNYNGYGYEDPDTVYKLQWHAALGKGLYEATVRYVASPSPTPVALIVDGHAQALVLPAGQGERSVTAHVLRDAIRQPDAMQLALTPPEPFVKGTPLGVKVVQVSLQAATTGEDHSH